MSEHYILLEGEEVYSIILCKENLPDPISVANRFYELKRVIFVAFIDLEFAEKTATISLRLLPRGHYAYIFRVRFTDVVLLRCLPILETDIQVFCPLEEIEGKFVVEELCLKLFDSLKASSS